MTTVSKTLISVVVPVFNEVGGLGHFHASLLTELIPLGHEFEIIYCDDGSTDGSTKRLHDLSQKDNHIRVIVLSRNFGKETATTAGIRAARGDAIITIDADGQHPVELIPEFIEHWKAGSKVVVGIKIANQNEGFVKHFGSKLFYGAFGRFTGIKMLPGASDFRLIDQMVQREFAALTERNRMTRGLIDWLGFPRDYIKFTAHPRLIGESPQSFRKLFRLAIDSMISLSISPLYLTAYIGAVVLPISVLVGLTMLVNVLFGDPLSLHATAGSYVVVFILFLVSILLVSQGIIGLYLSHIHTETQNRPLYVVDEEKSIKL
jgi:glycosyltransferase involved in cell wall biosynthesis